MAAKVKATTQMRQITVNTNVNNNGVHNKVITISIAFFNEANYC